MVEILSEKPHLLRVSLHGVRPGIKTVCICVAVWLCVTCVPTTKLRSVPLTDILEVRAGYNTDNLHRAAKHYSFQEAAPEATCFSVIFTHAKFLHKSVDFAASSKEDRDRWVSALSYLISKVKEQRAHFNEKEWIIEKFHQADTNKNGSLTFAEVWNLLKKMNLQISEKYAKAMFKESEDKSTRDGVLNEQEFLNFFDRLTERPELNHLLRMASSDGVESLTSEDLQKFLTEEQDVGYLLFAAICYTFAITIKCLTQHVILNLRYLLW
ncbi:hypothetical protein OESDEN_21288 [Oesophagostomum dentatum]|uniref:EF hand n=1 Tax=Oesophagostomum dentatum TaxID=61180 RepID=A0A0B1S2C2_OESDE|nr:hypothetical protein OESDEN_21288 [Oesophagostomum dentatum]